ncbi:MAG: glutamate synthase (NADPH), homotetrameric [Actinobacteria bacterium]|nr:MAG: glutamate synthase (NADPH), homotetrameric [Actinomycetota bacterium]
MKMERTDMPMRDACDRATDFEEVNLGYTSAMAVLEASRCIECKRAVCIDGCPVGIRIDDFLRYVAEGDIASAAAVIHEDNLFPAICGRVCPQESQCEGACVLDKKGRPIAIGHLERFVADRERTRSLTEPPRLTPPTDRKVAVIGSGPAGLACAGDLAREGHAVTVFEALHELGGVLVYGIPEFRLPKEIVASEISRLEKRGVRFETDVLIGSGTTLEELTSEEGFDAVFIGTGAGLPRFPGIEGEELIGVYSANEFLTRVNLMKAHESESETPVYDLYGRSVVVIGGGNTAVDAARTSLRLGADPVKMLYRRSDSEMPARREEIEHAIEEGVEIRYLVAPTSFNGVDGWLESVTIQEMRLGEPDESGRARPEAIKGAFETIEAAVAIIAIGNSPNPVLTRSTPDLATTKWGTIEVDEGTGETSIPGVFAGGDITTGGATVILALGAGRKAAAAINEYLVS